MTNDPGNMSAAGRASARPAVGLPEFLLARYAERAALAKAAAESVVADWAVIAVPYEGTWITHRGGHMPSDSHQNPEEKHAEYHSPARVLADVEAHVALVTELARMERDEVGWDGIEYKVMRYLAAPFADHPDYDERWAL